MKFTLSDCMQRINQILNYPSVAYEDISHFFDHAIAELNTILRTAIPSVSEMVLNNTVDTSLQQNTVLLNARPNNSNNIPWVQNVPASFPHEEDREVGGEVVHVTIDSEYVYYYNPAKLDRKFYAWTGSEWRAHESLYGVVFEGAKKYTYLSTPLGFSAYWVEVPNTHRVEFDLCEHMTMDWWTLFVIPYVCFKFAVRNGDDGSLYSDEFTQGMQQLQTCYDVPNFVVLSDVAGIPAYTEIVKSNLNDLNKKIPTKAITEDMRVGNAIQACFGNMFDTGGWGI
jgi:hypothetical protein